MFPDEHCSTWHPHFLQSQSTPYCFYGINWCVENRGGCYALASYFGCTEEVLLNERVASLEAKVTVLEGFVRGSQPS